MIPLSALSAKADKITFALSRAKEDRADIVRSIIKEVISLSQKEGGIFSSRKAAKKFFLMEIKKNNMNEADNYVRRGFRIAEKIILDGYSVKYEVLTLAQMEQLCKFPKARVKKLFTLEEEEYVEAVQELIASAKIEKTVKVFSPKKAKEIG